MAAILEFIPSVHEQQSAQADRHGGGGASHAFCHPWKADSRLSHLVSLSRTPNNSAHSPTERN